jgi:hypothetical protein
MRRPFSTILTVFVSLFLVIPHGLTTAQHSSGPRHVPEKSIDKSIDLKGLSGIL